MFSLQRFLGKDGKFFDLLESSAREAYNCTAILNRLIKDPSQQAILHDLRSSRQKIKSYTEELGELVVRSFVTALEREDIEVLAEALYKISKPIEKFAERYTISITLVPDVDFSKQAALLEEGAKTVLTMVQTLRKGINVEATKTLNAKLQALEAEADQLEVALLHDLYTSKRHSSKIIIIKDLYDLLERVVDRCRDTGNVVLHIVLKNS